MPEDRTHVVLGAGSAGNSCGRMLARAGVHVVSAEEARTGGTCLWWGCMPKKSLYHAARTYREASEAEQFGVLTGEPGLDWPGVLAWKWHAQESYAGDQDEIARSAGIELVKEPARFVDEDVVLIGDRRVRFDTALVSTGSKPRLLDVPGADLADYSRDALSYPELPSSLVIVGGGFIAAEFAGIFASFGTDVTVLMHGDRLVHRVFDEDISSFAERALGELGVELRGGVSAGAFSGQRGAITTQVVDADGEEVDSIVSERVLVAIGRVPQVDALDLDAAGIEVDERGRTIFGPPLRSTNPRVWFGGDAKGPPMFTPVAGQDGRQIGRHLLGGPEPEARYDHLPSTCFTVPQLAVVGKTEQALRREGADYRVASMGFDHLGAAIIADRRKGMVKILTEPDGTVIGAQVAGESATDLSFPLALAVHGRTHVSRIAETRGVHPAFNEVLGWAASSWTAG